MNTESTMLVTAIAPWFLPGPDSKVRVNEETGCWEWQKARNEKGYGVSGLPKTRRTAFAHRLAYLSLVGPIPAGQCVLHRCDNPRCCNPDHLFLGDRIENNRDMLRKGRYRASGSVRGKDNCNYERGERHHHAVLSEEDIRRIRTLHAEGHTSCYELGKLFGVTRQAIGKIVRRERWVHVK